jgi:hypothetical protein
MSMLVFCCIMSCQLAGAVDTDVSERHVVFVFSPEDRSCMFLRNAGIYIQVTRRCNTEDQHRHENITSRIE